MLYCAALVLRTLRWLGTVGIYVTHVGVVVGVLTTLPNVLHAQVVGGPRPAPISEAVLGFLTRIDSHATGARIAESGANKFKWDTDIGVDMDVFDLNVVRGNVFINVETIVGDERRAIDPNQANYTFDLSVFTRLPRGEFGTTFHHISRHLSDRENFGSPAWNMLGLSYGDRHRIGSFDVEFIGRWLGVIESTEIDYKQEVNGYVRVLRHVNDRLSILGEVDGSMVLVDQEMFGRPTQHGGRVEAGVRIRGGVGAVELIVGRERRIDAGVFERTPVRWTRFAFRFVLD